MSNLDLYTRANATIGGNDGNVTWFSALNSTVSGQPIPETGFHFNLTGPSLRETVNYTLNIPGGFGTSTFLRFQWNGTVGPGTSARYLVLNSTSNTNTDPTKIVTNVFRPGNHTGTFFGSNSSSSTGGVPLACGPTEECVELTRYVGLNITLEFLFNSTSTASIPPQRLKVTVSNVEVASIEPPTQAISHSLTVNPNDPTQIDHDGRLLITFNSTITYQRPSSNQPLNHTWDTVLLSFYLPKTYRSINVTLGTTQIDNYTSPQPRFFATHGFAEGACTTQGIVQCTGSIFFSVNATGFEEGIGRTVLVKALSTNALTSIATALGGADTDFWTPGDNMTVRVINSPGVNVTGTQVALLEPTPNSNGIIPLNVTLSTTARAGTANYTITIPSSVLQLGNWILTLTFANGFDYGSKTHDITIDEIQVGPGLSASGGVGTATTINVAGKLSYLSDSSAARNTNVTTFAIGRGAGTSLLTRTAPPASGLYISNITTVVGVGSPQQPIIMYFALVNPNATQSTQYDANITIDHEWYPDQTHGVNVTIPLVNIDNGNNFLYPITYSLAARLTSNGIQLTLQSLTTKAQLTVNMTPGVGASAVPFLRQHFGYFKITLHAKIKATGTLETPLPAIESAPYAYLLYTPTLPSRLLAYSSTTPTSVDGSFSASLVSNQLLGVKKLQVIVLARDANGIVLGDESRDPTVFSDSSVLQPSADSPSSVAVQQTVTTTLHLKSNSTSLVTSLTVNLDITGPTTLPTQTSSVTIQPRATADVKFTFTAPSSSGKYAITFSSPQYGGTGQPLLSKTLVVSVVSSNLQIIIVVALGLVAAAVIVSIYVRGRQPPAETETPEKTRPKTTGSPKSKADDRSRNP